MAGFVATATIEIGVPPEVVWRTITDPAAIKKFMFGTTVVKNVAEEGEESPMPTLRHGKICHIELPAADPQASADFYERVFGWKVRCDGGALVFDDPTEEVSGHWVPHRPPSEPGLLFYVWVDDVAAAIERVVAEGCELVQPIGGDPGEVTARFRDPGGNVVGLYQEPR